ncbi:MAG: mechanosensitive ion channel family protein [Planctomycetota bacterium]|jgi:small-conductance mechanosensitive channel
MVIFEAGGYFWSGDEMLYLAIRAGALVLVGLPLVYLLSRWLRRFFTERFSAQQGLVVGKGVLYGGVLLVLTMGLHQLGFRLTALLGAAGIAGIAIGFASQTSISNIISGLFLMVEKPFAIGDAVKVNDFSGEVLTIDLMSVKIRTFDNKLVRIPNETVVKSTITNFSAFPIRRVDIDLAVAYRENLTKVREILMEIAEGAPLVLAEPAPTLLFSKLTDTGVEILFGVWAERSNYGPVKNAVIGEIRDRFAAEGIDTPNLQVDLMPGKSETPLRVETVDPPKRPGRKAKKR